MPFALLIIGLLLVVTSAKDTHTQLGDQLRKDFTGTDSFFVWVLALGLIGAAGYVEKIRGVANAFLALVLLSMFLSNSRRGDFLTLLQQGLTNPTPPAKPTTTAPSGKAGGEEKSSGASGWLSMAGGAVGMIYGGPAGSAIGSQLGGSIGGMFDK